MLASKNSKDIKVCAFCKSNHQEGKDPSVDLQRGLYDSTQPYL